MGNKNNLITQGPGYFPDTTPATIFNAGGFGSAIHILLRQLTVCNQAEVPASFSIWIARGSDPAGSPDGATALFSNKVVQPGETLNFYFSPGIRFRGNVDYVVGIASGANTLTYTLSLDSFLFDWQVEN